MTAQFPVHPDDIEQLLKIRRYLIGYRHTNEWSQPQLSQMINATDGGVYDLETNQTWQWRWSRLQEWGVPFGCQLRARFWLPDAPQTNDEVHYHPEVFPFYQLSVGSSNAWKVFQRSYVTAALRMARRAQGITTDALGLKLGCTAKAINNWENASNEVMLPKVLHYARAINGFFQLYLWEPRDE